MAREVHGQRSRGRARRGILGHAARGREHARLPARAGAGEAAHPEHRRHLQRAPRSRAAARPPRPPSRARRTRSACRCRRARSAARSARRATREAARPRPRTAPTPGAAAPSGRRRSWLPSRSSATGTTPAFVSSLITESCSGAASTNAVPSVGCPANGSSVAGVKIRIRACPSLSGGSTKTVSERFISRASLCICSVSRPRPSVKTASPFPASGVSVKTSAIT